MAAGTGSEAPAVAQRASGRGLVQALAGAPILHGLARVGFVAKALLYGVVGSYALRIVLGGRGATLDVKQALDALRGVEPAGMVMAVVAVAIGGLGVWFVLEGLANTGGGRGAWAAVTRVGQALGGLGYVLLAVAGVRAAMGGPSGPTGNELARSGVAESFAVPGGPAVVVILGLAAVGVGLRQAFMGMSGRFLRSVDLSPTSRAFRHLAAALGALGFATQGLLFALVGVHLVQAVARRDPGEATGTGGALGVLSRQPYGDTLLAVASLGLLAYAVYAGIEGASRRFPGAARAGRGGAPGRPGRRGALPS